MAKASALWVLFVSVAVAAGGENVELRGSLDNCRIRFEQQRAGHVAFIGGSITEMNGYRPMVCELLQKRLPAHRPLRCRPATRLAHRAAADQPGREQGQ